MAAPPDGPPPNKYKSGWDVAGWIAGRCWLRAPDGAAGFHVRSDLHWWSPFFGFVRRNDFS